MAYSRNITLFYNPNNENDALPIEVIDHIGRFSGTKGIGRLRKVCKNAESSLSRTLVESMVQSLLKHVMWGEQDQAENIISKLKISCPDDYSLAILQKSSGVEHCDRVWKLISPLEFAAQAGDKFMVDMLLKYISPAYKQRALDQLKYVLHQGTEHGKHLVALTLVIDAYERHTTMFRTWNVDERKEHWIHGIGGAQLQLPLSVLQDFLSHQELSPLKRRDDICKYYRPFYMAPNFDVPPKRVCNVYDGSSVTPTSSGLGNVVAFYRIEHKDAYFTSNLVSEVSYGPGHYLWIGYSDLMVFKHYCNVRTEHLVNQILSLELELQKINQPSEIAAADSSSADNKPSY